MVNGRSKRTLITGVAGYVGPTLIRHLDKFPDSKLVGFDTRYVARTISLEPKDHRSRAR